MTAEYLYRHAAVTGGVTAETNRPYAPWGSIERVESLTAQRFRSTHDRLPGGWRRVYQDHRQDKAGTEIMPEMT